MQKFLRNNLYFVCGDKIYRQKTGILMGLDPTSQMFNGNLHNFDS